MVVYRCIGGLRIVIYLHSFRHTKFIGYACGIRQFLKSEDGFVL